MPVARLRHQPDLPISAVFRHCPGTFWLCYCRALKLGDAARVAPIDKLSIVLVAVFAVVLLARTVVLVAALNLRTIGEGASA